MAIQELNILSSLDFKKQVTFAYLASERAFPNYNYFVQNFQFGDVNIMRNAIDFVQDSIFKASFDSNKIEYFLSETFNKTPHTNDFTTFYATTAMYSGGIIYESVNLLKNKNNSKILLDISTMSIDIVDSFIQERDDMQFEDQDFEKKIARDPLMQSEIKRQKGIISFLAEIGKIDHADIETLRQLQGDNLPLIL